MDLLRDIETVLESGSLSFRSELFANVPAIIVTTADGNQPACIDGNRPACADGNEAGERRQVILPLEIAAENVEQAVEDQRIAADAVAAVKAKTGRAPIIITEDHWNRHREAMAARLLAHLGRFQSIFARNCEVRKITRTDAAAFLDDYHSYGDAKSRYHYGIFHKGQLVAAAEFSNARKWRKSLPTRANEVDPAATTPAVATAANLAPTPAVATAANLAPTPAVATAANLAAPTLAVATAANSAATAIEIRSYEWVRYASLPGTRIIGGMGKVLKHFIEEQHPDDIMSYADLEWSEGAVYQALGFEDEGTRRPVVFRIGPDWSRTALGSIASGNSLLSCGSRLHGEQGSEAATAAAPEAASAAAPEAEGIGTESLARNRYFMNFGSVKYRLKLTNYK